MKDITFLSFVDEVSGCTALDGDDNLVEVRIAANNAVNELAEAEYRSHMSGSISPADESLYRELRLKHGLSYGPWSEREVLGGVGFLSLNADLERENLPEAEQVLQDLQAHLLKNGLDPAVFARVQHAAISRQAWAVQGNSALADYYWGALGDYEDGRFVDPARELQGVTLEEANKAMRELLMQPGYLRIEKPLLSYDQVLWVIGGVLGLLLLSLAAWRFHRNR